LTDVFQTDIGYGITYLSERLTALHAELTSLGILVGENCPEEFRAISEATEAAGLAAHRIKTAQRGIAARSAA